MTRLALAALLLATPLSAQSRDSTVAPPPRDSTAIRGAAKAFAPKPEIASVLNVVIVRADTAWATVYFDAVKGQIVRVERRANKWVAIHTDSPFVFVQ